jgi:trimethylamine--corrinoid protein Co-methyltransferase
VPCSVIAGATDSKLPDNQAGYEKALSIDTAIRAGANLVTQAAGMQAGLMAVNYSAMVADNEMLGAILRANQVPEINAETVNLQSIARVIEGDGHFLGQPETYARMKSDFLYPTLADRSTIDEWVTAGSKDLGQRAHDRAEEILAEHWPSHLDEALVGQFCARHNIDLPRRGVRM